MKRMQEVNYFTITDKDIELLSNYQSDDGSYIIPNVPFEKISFIFECEYYKKINVSEGYEYLAHFLSRSKYPDFWEIDFGSTYNSQDEIIYSADGISINYNFDNKKLIITIFSF